MGRTNACRAQQKRERNQAKAGQNSASQLKSNQAALNIVCALCRQTFLCTTSSKSLKDHSDNKHPKSTFEECFPETPEP